MVIDGNVLIVHGKHGAKKFEFKLSPQLTVADLCNEIEKATELPIHCQRVIYNGRALNNQAEDMKKTLSSLGLKSPAKILVLGKKPDEEDENYKLMKTWESTCDSAVKQLDTLHKDIDDMVKGFAPKELIDSSLPKIEKKINLLSEELMKILISLDALTFTESQKEARAKRKCMIDKIHSLHKKCDELSASIKELRAEKKA